MPHARRPRRVLAWATAFLLALAALVVPAGTADAAATVLRDHPHEGTAGALPAAAAEGYTGRTGKAAAYTGTPAASEGTTSIRFAGTAATYFTDTGLAPSTGQLVWSASLLLPSLPASGASDRFLAARTGSAALASVGVTHSGVLQVRNGGGTIRATGTTPLAVGTWYRVEVMFSGGRADVRLFDPSGSLLDELGPVTVTAGTPTALRTGAVVTGGPVLVDHVQLADDWLTAVPPPPPPPPPPCGALADRYDAANPPRYEHVVVIMEENWSYEDFAASTDTPYLTQLAAGCGNETNFHAATHPSQPNYMAATSGVPTKAGAMTANDNVFAQMRDAGLDWRSYEESMPSPCSAVSQGTYKPGHNPAVYYSGLRSPNDTCAQFDLPLSPSLDTDLQNDTLPEYAWVTPNLCHDFHWQSGCGFASSQAHAQGDAWLAAFLPRLAALQSYQDGRTLIVVTFDEGREDTNTTGVDCTDPAYYATHADCQIPTVVVSPYLAGATDATDLNLYSLLATTEDMFGLARLGAAVGEPSMRATMPF